MIIEVLVAQNIAKPLTYRVPQYLRQRVKIGQAITVPIKNRETLAYVFKLLPEDTQPEFELKDIVDIKTDYSFFSQNTVVLLEWLSLYYVIPLIHILKSILPIGAKSNKNFNFKFNRAIKPIKTNITKHISNLITEQQQAFKFIISKKRENCLLHGITGSGKTEVYIALIHHCLGNGESALILVPEIALTLALQERLKKDFGDLVIPCHSKLTNKERQESWLKAYNLPISIVIGTRSAVFAPINNLGLIIIDEEQDGAYKQDNSPRYNSKVVAFKKGKIEEAQVVVGSATPLVSTYYQAKKYYHIIELQKRYKGTLPSVQIINFTGKYRPNNLISNELILSINKNLQKKEQTIIYYNQRGLYRFLNCEECGYAVQCPNCSVTLTVHKNNILKCHHCNHKSGLVEVCPKCNSVKMSSKGKGIQFILNSFQKIFPFAKIGRLDSDNNSKNAVENILNEFSSGNLDILIGTQMLAKGHNFPNVTLVGIIDADIGLSYPDIYASERVFNLLTQVIGRTGRGEKKGKVIIQTFNPNYYALKFAINQDYASFYKHELQFRKESLSPPFSRIIKIILDHTVEEILQKEIDILYKTITESFTVFEYYPPTYELVYKVKRRFRMNFMIKFKRNNQTVHDFKTWMLDKIKNNKLKSTIIIDVDPIIF